MKKSLIAFALVASGLVSFSAESPMELYLLIGQSNMAGRGKLTADNRVSAENIFKFTADGRWVPAEEPIHCDKKSAGAGLAASFACEMAAGRKDVRIGLIPCAVGGTPVRRWVKGADLYENAVRQAKKAMADGQLKGVLWHQGESDTKSDAAAEAWGKKFESLVSALREDLGDVPFVAGELGRYLDGYRPKSWTSTNAIPWRVINRRLHDLESRIPNFAVVSSEGLTANRDILHFNTKSLRIFGRRYAAAMRTLQGPTRVLPLSGSGWTADGVPVTVPHCWNVEDGADGPGPERAAHADRRTSLELLEGYARKAVLYRRALPDPTAGKRQFLKVDAAATVATVKVNGREVGVHKGAFTAFCYEITKFLKPGGNELEIVVDNRRNVDVAPISGDYTMMGGLYRKVWLVETPQVCIDRTIDGGPGVELDIRMDGHVTAKVHVLGGPDEVRELHFPDPERWSPENPKLYEAKVELASGDSVTVPFGFRTVEFRPDGFYLNGQKRKLKGVCRHQEVGGKGWATSMADEESDIALIREMGADAVRTAHYPQSDSFYSLLDRGGFVAWCEVPLLNGVTHSAAFVANLKTQYREMVAQLKHHPSICMWSIFNELYENFPMPDESAEPLVEAFAAWAKPVDPTRPQVAASDQVLRTRLNRIPADALAFNRYPGWYNGPIEGTRAIFDEMFASNAARQVFGISEYGGGGSIAQHGDPLVPCKESTVHTEEYQAWLHARYYAEIAKEPRLWGTFLWVMFDFASDYRTEGDHPGINDKGLVCHDHRTKKDAFYFYRANWTKTPTLRLVGRRMGKFAGDKLNLLAFSNVGPVTLSVNGAVVGTKDPDEVATVLFKDVSLASGVNRISVTAGGLTDSYDLIRDKD